MALSVAQEKAIQDFVVACSGLTDSHVFWADGKPRPNGTYISMVVINEDDPANDEAFYEANPLDLTDDSVESVDTVADRLTLTAHAYETGDGPVTLASSGSMPGGLFDDVDYWIVVTTANTIRLTTSRALALAGSYVDITSAGTGTITISGSTATRRVGEEIRHTVRGPRRIEVQLQCFSTTPAGVAAARAVLSKTKSRSQLPTPYAILNAAEVGLVGFEAVQVIGAVGNFVVFEPRATTVLVVNVVSSEYEAGTTIEATRVTNGLTGRKQTITRSGEAAQTNSYSDGFSSGFEE